MKLVLFDIDGTILWTDGAGRRAIRQALITEMGTAGPIDEGYRLDGKTDPQIVRELLAAAGHPQAESEDHVFRVCRRYVQLLAGELGASRARTRLFPGVEPLLTELEHRGDAVLGLLTGNLAEGAALKLQAAGLDPARFRVGAYGSDAAERVALPPIAAHRAESLMERPPSGADVVIIGDTPADVTCGEGIGARAIGVATGHYSCDDLLAAGAFAAFENLAERDPVLHAIFA
ncbi:MAG: haloacid dehalogenase-like hydrolase [Gemmatimonadetes bacterium]|nr:haloacid dehalogenase-like hydrolase [Gemmatimonadota bacterium]